MDAASLQNVLQRQGHGFIKYRTGTILCVYVVRGTA
jgi:hypothetical protein